MDSETILDVSNFDVKIRLGDTVYPIVRNISFQLKRGKTLALVGESGCGKSMTALSILRIAQAPVFPPTGKVLFNGEDLTSISESHMRKIRGGKIAMIFQDPSNSLNPVFTIGNQLKEAAMLHLNIDEELAEQKAIDALTAVGIPSPASRMNDYPHQFSGGMKQRVMIAMAIIAEPKILIADEPTTALDVTIQAQVLELLKNLQTRTQMSILLITHDMGVVAEVADDVAVMYAGTIVEQGDVFQVFRNPSHPYTMGLFESLNRVGVQKGNLHTIKGTVPPLYQIPSGCPFHPRCPFAFEKCYQGEVPNFDIINEPGHKARCWLRE